MNAHLTLNKIRAKSPCHDGWTKLLKFLGKTKADDEPLSLLTVLESNGLDDALWCLRALPKEMDGPIRLMACDFAERVLRFVPEGEDRPRQAIEVARRYARGEATKEELAAARSAAIAAAIAAASAAARSAASAAAWSAAIAAASAAARAAERDRQADIFRQHVTQWESMP